MPGAENFEMLSRLEPSTYGLAVPRSQAAQVYEVVRGDILSGRNTPGRKLKIQEIADQLGVSPGAVREALSRLVAEQLVVSRDQRGFVVAPLSIDDLEDLTDMRCEVEAIALRRSAEHGDVEWEAGIIAAEHRLRATPIREDGVLDAASPVWTAMHARFHASLVAAAGSRRLLSLHSQLYEQSERYRGLSAHIESRRDVEGEHRRIAELALARDVEALIGAATEHLRTTTRLIVDAARERRL